MATTNGEYAQPRGSPSEPIAQRDDEEAARLIGQMIMVGFDGLSVTPEIRMMIEKYYVGNIILTRRNIQDGVQLASLTQELQNIAQSVGFDRPLIIGIDQENGMISRLGDGKRATQFPGAMALGATRSQSQAFDIAKATAKELVAVGINWNFAPVLDVINEHNSANVGVRAFGDDPQLVGGHGVAFAEGLRAGGMGHCVKHFPSTGKTTNKDGSRSSTFNFKARDDLEMTELVPFRKAVAAGLDSVMLTSSVWEENGDGGMADAKHVIHDVLRRQLGYDGLTLCDTTDMPSFTKRSNIGEAAVMAIRVGCDMLQILAKPETQKQAIEAIYEATRNGNIIRSEIYRSSGRVMRLKQHYLNWRTALATPDSNRLPSLMQEHQSLARKIYENSTTVVRDEKNLIPLSARIRSSENVLLLTPVVRPLHQRAPEDPPIDPFECFGKALARKHPKIRHAPYTVHGITSTHVALIKRASAVIFVTVNANRPHTSYQLETAGAVHRLCLNKPLVTLAACDPYDLLIDRTFGTYICTYEYSQTALETAAEVIIGGRHAPGVLPVSIPGTSALRQQHQWFVEVWEKRRDLFASADLWRDCLGRKWPLDASTLSALLDRPGQSKHFVVRHTMTKELLGLAVTYTIQSGRDELIGSLALLIVRPTHRNSGIGRSLHDVALRHLSKQPGMTSLQLGSIFPRIFPGLPVDLPAEDLSWFSHRGWKLGDKFIYDLMMKVDSWTVPEGIFGPLQEKGVSFGCCNANQFDALLDFEEKNFSTYTGWVEKYHSLKATDDIADAMIAYTSEGIVGAAFIFSPVGNNQMSRDVPWPKVIGERVGGLACLGVGPEYRGQGVGLGLICAAILELKQRGMRACFVDWVDLQGTYEQLGFTQWGKYREIWRNVA
ncbi:glycoside hydrolase superfamily [Morchella snyderi]|nr:glycoside hydrolase superfamily [Morchella snyderi]